MYRDRHRSGEKEGERGRPRRYLKGHRRVSSCPPVIRGRLDRRLHFLLDLPVAIVVVVDVVVLFLFFLRLLTETAGPYLRGDFYRSIIVYLSSDDRR